MRIIDPIEPPTEPIAHIEPDVAAPVAWMEAAIVLGMVIVIVAAVLSVMP